MSAVKIDEAERADQAVRAGGADQAVTARPLRADACRNRERLLESARTVFAARGSGATVEEIAKAAGVGVGTLYRHFPRRIDLVEAVYREDVEGLVALAAQLSDTAGPWEALVGWLEGFVRYAQAKRTFLTELHEAFEKSPDLAVQSREKIAEAVGTVLMRAQGAGAARDDLDQYDLMQLVGGMCMARNATLEQNERLLTFLLDGIRARPGYLAGAGPAALATG
jgi:AcrR family transcriptional regulator